MAIDVDEYLLLTRDDESGETPVTSNHYFRVPNRRRRQADITVGDHVLLVADRSAGQLRIYPPSALDRLFSPAVNGVAATR
ncbi:hypothetical protein [Nocardia salmonicida]|uniref:hypothetical protein n=1 Tax=Nocardia salmonicida TaxID=53431 RepID=UPI0036301FB9